MDLNELVPTQDILTVELVHPSTGDLLENEDGSIMTITRYAPESKEYKAVMHSETNRQLKQSQKRKKLDLKAEDIEQSALNILAKTTKDWNITYDGDMPEFSVSLARELYSKIFWIKDQVEEAEADYLDFTKP